MYIPQFEIKGGHSVISVIHPFSVVLWILLIHSKIHMRHLVIVRSRHVCLFFTTA